MPYDERTARRVRRLLCHHGEFVEKKMMGGLCFMLGGNMCCGVTQFGLMLRVGREAYEDMLARPHVRPLEFGGRRPRGFVVVEPAAYRTEKALAHWLQTGIDFVATLPAKAAAARNR